MTEPEGFDSAPRVTVIPIDERYLAQMDDLYGGVSFIPIEQYGRACEAKDDEAGMLVKDGVVVRRLFTTRPRK